ncbi:MAG: hypothetical protein NC489_25090 [Ruminococcus flavefaciens]|nr:hypothetical protein [Ruminococcus flavefaciens]
MRTDKEMDKILCCALTQNVKPDAKIQQKVLDRWKENHTMKFNKKWPTAAVVTACLVAAAVPVTAATLHFLNAGQAAEQLGYGKLAEAFEDHNAIQINKSQAINGYIITLLGETSGKGLEKTEWNPDCESDGTYIVVSIEKEDGTPIDKQNADLFTVEPFIKGYDPRRVNPLYADDASGATWDVIDGVQYMLFGVGNLECLADHPMYVCVTDDIVYSSDMYHYDEETGVITRNEDYKGVNALFDLQLDASKADKAKAEEYLKQFEEFGADDSQEEENTDQLTQEYVDFMKAGDWKTKIKEAELKIGPTEVKRDKNGACPFEMEYALQADNGSECSGTLFFYDEYFIEDTAVQVQEFGSDDVFYEQISVAEKTDDDTITVKIYLRKMTQEEN